MKNISEPAMLNSISQAQLETLVDVKLFWDHYRSPKSALLKTLLIVVQGTMGGLASFYIIKNEILDYVIGFFILIIGFAASNLLKKRLLGLNGPWFFPKEIKNIMSPSNTLGGFLCMLILSWVVLRGFRFLAEWNSSYLLFLLWGVIVATVYNIIIPLYNRRIVNKFKKLNWTL